MPYFLILLLLLFFNVNSVAETNIALERISIDQKNVNAIKRGGKFFATNCMVCHTMKYLRYDSLANAAGVSYDKMPINVTQWPNDVRPPDLSLVASHRGTDWLYTYLHSFYLDSSRPTGANNLLVANTAMPNILLPYQGQQILVSANQIGKKFYDHENQWYDLLALQTQGTMNPTQFDETITDLVIFLAYASNPYQTQQRHLGKFVLGFLIILAILMYLLKREYWKNV